MRASAVASLDEEQGVRTKERLRHANLRSIGQGFTLYLKDSKEIFPRVSPLHGSTNPNDPSLLDLLSDPATTGAVAACVATAGGGLAVGYRPARGLCRFAG